MSHLNENGIIVSLIQLQKIYTVEIPIHTHTYAGRANDERVRQINARRSKVEQVVVSLESDKTNIVNVGRGLCVLTDYMFVIYVCMYVCVRECECKF